MKFKVYYGKGFDSTENKMYLAEYDSLEEAENFVKENINANHTITYYLRIAYISETCRWYDYGSHSLFYLIKGE